MENELIGYVAGIFVAVSLLPQVLRSHRSKSTADISLLWTIIMLVGLSLWIVYAVTNNLRPLLLFAIIEFCLTGSLLLLKLKYK